MRGFLLYARMRIEKEQDAALWRGYMAETVRYINASLAQVYGGTTLRSFIELMDDTPEETRTPEEIISGIKAKLRKGGGEHGGI